MAKGKGRKKNKNGDEGDAVGDVDGGNQTDEETKKDREELEKRVEKWNAEPITADNGVDAPRKTYPFLPSSPSFLLPSSFLPSPPLVVFDGGG